MPVARTRIWLDMAHDLRGKSENFRSSVSLSLNLGFTLAPPGDKHATHTQERRCILGNDGEWGESTSRDDVPALSGGLGHLLGPRREDGHVRQRELLDGAAKEVALAAVRLDEGDPGFWERDGEREAGNACPGADIDECPGGADDLKLEGDESIGDVVVPDSFRDAYRRRSELVSGKQREQFPEARFCDR
nr:hypothetical protein [Conexibacter sp. DBS9H8]